MDYFMWAKAILLCGRRLKRVIGELDVTMDTLALCSGTGAQDAYGVMEHAADVIARKTRIINLRVITGDMLDSLPQDMRRLLALRYVSGSSAEELSRNLGIPLRSLYRRLDKAIAACADYLKRMGFDNEYFERYYGDEHWIISRFKKFTEKEELYYRETPNFVLHRPSSAALCLPRACLPRGGGAGA